MRGFALCDSNFLADARAIAVYLSFLSKNQVAMPNTPVNPNLKPVNPVRKDTGPKKSLNLADYKKKRGLI